MTIQIGLALIAASAPLTAIILVYMPKKNGKYVTTREYDLHRTDLLVKLGGINGELGNMNARIQDLTTAVNAHLG